MTSVDFVGIRLDAYDVSTISTFWSQLLGWPLEDRADGGVVVVPAAPSSYPLIIGASGTPKSSQNRIHFDLTTQSAAQMDQLISRAYGLTCRRPLFERR